MRKIISTTFTTLDGVMQAPGGPQEDTSGGFAYGGWQFNKYSDKLTGETMTTIMGLPFDLLLGRWTYDLFAAYWPNANEDQGIARKFNNATKYVVSHHPKQLSWRNSTLITGDVPARLREIKQSTGPDLWVWGSGNLIQTLLAQDLLDSMFVWTFPLTVGGGKRLFAEGTRASAMKLVDSKVSTTGVIIATYEPAGALRLTTGGPR